MKRFYHKRQANVASSSRKPVFYIAAVLAAVTFLFPRVTHNVDIARFFTGSGMSGDKTVQSGNSSSNPDNNPGIEGPFKVLRVADGDTIVIDYYGSKEKVRFIGVNSPESVKPNSPVEPYGKEAAKFTRKNLDGKYVTLEFDVDKRDKYGRLLAYVYVDGVMFNKTLLEEGYAQLMTIPPDVKYVDEFKEIQRMARENNKGLWAR